MRARRHRADDRGAWRWALAPLAAWAATVAPSAVAPAWGSLDDGMTLWNATRGPAVFFASPNGRILPIYWAHNWLLYHLAGTDVGLWYGLQALEVLLAALLLFLAVRRVGAPGWAAALAAANLPLSSPIAENVYTISKQEPRVTLAIGILAAVLAGALARARAAPGPRRLPAAAALVGAGALVVFAKESGLTALALGLAGLGLSSSRAGLAVPRAALRVWAFAAGSLAASVLGLLLARHVATRGSGRDYLATSISWTEVGRNLDLVVSRWPDVLLTGAAAFLIGLAALILRRRAARGGATCLPVEDRKAPLDDAEALVLGWAFLAFGAAYLALIVSWRSPAGYHLLPVAACFSVALGCLAGVREVRSGLSRVRRRALVGFALVIVVAGKAYALPSIQYVASAQRLFDRSESVLQSQATALGGSLRVVDFDRFWYAEPPFQRTLLFRVFGHPRQRWVGAGELLRSFDPAERALYPPGEPVLERQPLRARELAVVQGIDYPFPEPLRGVGPGAFVPTAELGERVAAARERAGRGLVPILRVESSRRVFAPWTLRPAELRVVSLLLRAGPPAPFRARWEGQYGDWTAPHAALTLEANGAPLTGALRVRMLPIPALLPLEVRLTGVRRVRLALRPGALDQRVPIATLLPPSGGRISIDVARSWRPRDYLPGSPDGRELGVQVSYEP